MILRPLLNLLSPPSERPWWVRACVVILSVGTSIAIRIYLDPWLGDKAPFGMLMPAVLRPKRQAARVHRELILDDDAAI